MAPDRRTQSLAPKHLYLVVEEIHAIGDAGINILGRTGLVFFVLVCVCNGTTNYELEGDVGPREKITLLELSSQVFMLVCVRSLGC